MRGFEDVPIDWAPASAWTDDEGLAQQTVEFIVPGRPVPKGSVIKGRWGGYHDTADGIYEWMDKVRIQAANAMAGGYRRRDPDAVVTTLPRFSSAVMVDVTFVHYRPKSTPKTKTPQAIKKPDVDKELRAILDAMTDIVYLDDAQVVETHIRKRLAYPEETPGAIILVTSNVRVQ